MAEPKLEPKISESFTQCLDSSVLSDYLLSKKNSKYIEIQQKNSQIETGKDMSLI